MSATGCGRPAPGVEVAKLNTVSPAGMSTDWAVTVTFTSPLLSASLILPGAIVARMSGACAIAWPAPVRSAKAAVAANHFDIADPPYAAPAHGQAFIG
jgi:hypothetical protein